MWWKTLLNFLGGGVIQDLSDDIKDAYKARLEAQTSEQKLEADMVIRQLELRQALLLTEQKRWLTAWIRPALAFPVVVLVNKLLIWDTVLGLGVTPDPGQLVNWIVVTIIGAYMLTRPFGNK